MNFSGFNNIKSMPRKYMRQVQPKYSHCDLIKALDAIKHEKI